MPRTSVFCLARSHDLAGQIMDRVKTSGFSMGDAFALFPDQVALISVHTGNPDEINRAKVIFMETGAQDICATGESSTSKESKATDHTAHPAKAAYSHERP